MENSQGYHGGAGQKMIEFFGPMQVINLPSRKDRYREFQQTLGQIGLSFDHTSVNLFEAVRPATPDGFPSLGARGCFLSHLGILEEARDKGWSSVLICEDDLNFSEDFVHRAEPILDYLAESTWDLAYFGHHDLRPLDAIEDCPEIVEIPPSTGVRCTHFMVLRRDAIQRAVTYLHAMLQRSPGDPNGGPMHVDGAYSWLRRDNPDLRTLAVVPPLGYQRSSRTDIHELRWFDKLPVVRELSAFLRRKIKAGR